MMKKTTYSTHLASLLLLTTLSSSSSAAANSFTQQTTGNMLSLPGVVAPSDYDNIHINKLDSDEHASTYVIFIKKQVPLHQHKTHTEIVYILDGEGVMTLGKEQYPVSAGSYIHVPEGTPHSVQVTSNKPLKVLSIQTPEFFGKDRHPIPVKK